MGAWRIADHRMHPCTHAPMRRCAYLFVTNNTRSRSLSGSGENSVRSFTADALKYEHLAQRSRRERRVPLNPLELAGADHAEHALVRSQELDDLGFGLEIVLLHVGVENQVPYEDR